MYARVVTFRLAGLTPQQYEQHCEEIAAQFTHWPGLIAKVWLADVERNTFGGIYLFASEHDAERSRSSDLFRRMVSSPVFDTVVIDEYDVLDAPTTVTSGVFARSAAAAPS